MVRDGGESKSVSYVIESGAVDCSFNDLDRGIIAYFGIEGIGYSDLGKTERSRVWICVRSVELKGGCYGMAHVSWYGSESQVNVDEGCFMAAEPSGLERYGTTGNRPFCTVRSLRHSTTWSIHSTCQHSESYKERCSERERVCVYLTDMGNSIAFHMGKPNPTRSKRYPSPPFLVRFHWCAAYSLSTQDRR